MIGNIDNLLNFSGDLFQKKEMKPLMAEVAATARCLWDRGWAERSAGNFSLNVTGHFPEKEREKLSACPFFPLTRPFPALARQLFLVSGTGTRMREMAVNPAGSLCFIYISETGSTYHVISENHETGPVRPTSELLTHLALHQQFLQQSPREKVVLHAHVTELIALTQITRFRSEEALNSLFSAMHPEILLYIPSGAGFVPYTLAGTEQIAVETLKAFKGRRAVIWEKHGCLAAGESLSDAFDNMDILAKAARIWFMCRSAGADPEGLTEEQMAEMRRATGA